MAGYNYAQNIIGLKKGAGDIHELELEVAQLSASVLTIGEKLEDATTYSTDETIVGTWVDGSPIYEKTFNDTLPVITDNAFSTKTVALSSLNIKEVIDYDVVIKQIVNDLRIFVKTPYLTNAGLQIKSNVDAGNYISILSNAAAYSECPFYATIRYIKNEEIGG